MFAVDCTTVHISEDIGLFGSKTGIGKSILRLGNESLQCVSRDAKRAESRSDQRSLQRSHLEALVKL